MLFCTSFYNALDCSFLYAPLCQIFTNRVTFVQGIMLFYTYVHSYRSSGIIHCQKFSLLTQIDENKTHEIFLLMNNLVNEIFWQVACHVCSSRSTAQLSVLEYFNRRKLPDPDGPLS